MTVLAGLPRPVCCLAAVVMVAPPGDLCGTPRELGIWTMYPARHNDPNAASDDMHAVRDDAYSQ
ncbi:MAG TPA: hypothetical protein VJS67_08365 [Pseudonocardiaceae bacterium]|nr:hypothetical protein [Pseudonocardiaceae bacterium]